MQCTGMRVAGGEHCANSVLFKQFLASGALGFAQPDATRLGSINECIAVLLMAKKFNGEDIHLCSRSTDCHLFTSQLIGRLQMLSAQIQAL